MRGDGGERRGVDSVSLFRLFPTDCSDWRFGFGFEAIPGLQTTLFEGS